MTYLAKFLTAVILLYLKTFIMNSEKTIRYIELRNMVATDQAEKNFLTFS